MDEIAETAEIAGLQHFNSWWEQGFILTVHN